MLLNLGPEDLLSEGGPGRWVVAGIAGALLFGLMAAPVVAAFTRDGALQAFPGQDKKPVAKFVSQTTAGRKQSGVAFHESLKPGTLTLIIEHATEGADQIKLHDNGRGAFVLLDPDPRHAGTLRLEDSSVDYSTGEWKLNFSESLPLPEGRIIQASISPLPEAFGGVVRAPFGSTKAIAGAMFQNYLVPFELAGILLVVGIMGALLLSKERLRRLGDEVDTDVDDDTAADGTTEEETHV